MPPADAGTTRIQLCGRLKVDFEGRHVTPDLRGRQGRVLLAYLVINRGRPVSRAELITAIWPTSSPSDPSAALRTQLSRLRRALGAKALAGRDTVELHLPEGTWIDVEAAERAIRVADSALKAGDWRDAWAHAHISLNIAGRPFLAGFEAPWVDEVRHELEELELRSREVIARAGIGLGGSELAGAERSARALIRSSPFRESGYLNLMRTLVASGNTAEALRTYDNLRKLLAKELGSAPGGEIQALHRRLLTGAELGPQAVQPDAAPATRIPGGEPLPAPPSLPLPTWLAPRRGVAFVGRTEELGLLSQLWAESIAGTRQIVLVGGEPGVGKTRLVTEFAQRVHGDGATVLYGRADEEATRTFQPLIEALRHWVANAPTTELQRALGPNAATLATLVPEISVRLPAPAVAAEEAPDREGLLDAVVDTLASIAAEHPLLLLVDDLQWADPGSLSILRRLARSTRRDNLMVLATYRETEPSPALAEALADLGRERLFERLRLSGLSAGEVAEMIAAMRGGESEPGLADAIYGDTGGNPFLVEAVVNNMAAGGERNGAGRGRREEIYARGIPDLVREAVAHRVGELGPTAEQVLEIAAVIGREFESELLAEISDLAADEIADALEAAVAAGLLADVPGTLDRYTFSHALFRQTVYAGVAKQRRAMLHGRLGEALERRHGSDPRHLAELARHFGSAGPGAAPKALEYCVRAGAGALGALAFEEAVDYYTQALSALDATGSADERLRCEILLAIGEAEWRSGDASASRETFGRAARLAQGTGDAEAFGRAALNFCEIGWEWYGRRDDEAINLLRSALAKEGVAAPMRARLQARLAALLHFCGEDGQADELSREALELAEVSGSEEALAAALVGRWHTVSGPDGLAERQRLSERLTPLATALRNRDLQLQSLSLQVVVTLETGRFGDLEVAIAEHAKLADRMKQPTAQIHSRAFQAMGALAEGRFGDVEAAIGEMLELGTLTQSSTAVQLSSIELLALYFEQGRIAELEKTVRSLAEGAQTTFAWRAALAYVLAALERSEEARSLLDELAHDDFADLPGDGTKLGVLGSLALTAVQLGEDSKIVAVAELLSAYRDRPVVIGGAAAYAGS
ncbi:MAG TPA: AAA family ATPase, partial [Solirubrobacterales bacterium]|nr:AAA family ATPase [Solirubrobacterales bacterium]